MPDDLNQPSGPTVQVPPEPAPGIPEEKPEETPTPPSPPSGPSAPPGQRPSPPPQPLTEEPPIVISTPPKKSRVKVILAAIVGLLILASIPAGVYLVQQTQEIREKAEIEVGWDISCYPKVSFSDLPSTNPYYEAVTCLNGPPYCCIAGYPDQTFKPSQAITRAETVTFITSYHIWVRKDWQWQIPSQPSFPDLPYAHWSFPFIETAKYYGFISGYPDGTFKPDQTWKYGFHGVDQSEYDFTQEGPTISRGDFIQGLYDYGMGRNELPECLEATPTPTPTPPPLLLCLDLTASPSASLIPTHYHIIGGNTVLFTCIGSSSSDNPINHFEFRVQINGGEWENLGTAPASPTDDKYQGQKLYTIPDYGCYKIECRACVSTDSSNCTAWGQAQ